MTFILYSFHFNSGYVFSGCENFMVGSDAAEELNKSIEYENSPKFTVYTAMEYLESGNLISASTKEGVRVPTPSLLNLKPQKATPSSAGRLSRNQIKM